MPEEEESAPVFARSEPPADPPNDETNLNPTQVFDAAAVHANLPAVSRPSESRDSSGATGHWVDSQPVDEPVFGPSDSASGAHSNPVPVMSV